MLTDEQIENILYKYTERQDEFNLSVIRVIANRLSKIAEFDKLFTLRDSSIMTEDVRLIRNEFLKYRRDQKKRIHDDFWWLAFYVYGEALIYYEQQLALAQNTELVELINNAINEAQASFAELTQYPAFEIRDLSNPTTTRAYSLEDTYRSTINEAMSYNSLSDELRDIALKRTEMQLFDSRIRYATDNSFNETTSANNAIRFNLLDRVKSLINRMQDIMGRQFGATGVELSAHIYPAPDHAPAQGHQYTIENMDKMQSGQDFEDIDGHHYAGFERQIGTWNCRHYFMKVKLGREPTYTQEQLDKILEDNQRGYTAPNGRHYTLYECTQIQRRYERKIRNAKEKYLFSKTLGDEASMLASRTRVGNLTTQYKQFSRACGIPAKLERIKVKNY